MGKLIQRTGKPLHVDKPVTSEEIGLKGKIKQINCYMCQSVVLDTSGAF